MNSTPLEAEWDVWQAPGCAVRIAYSRAVLEELRLAACDGLNRLAHGGVEIGGVLFGVRDPDGVKILAYRALACEYAFGPTFTLWDNDRRALEKLLTAPDTDSNLAGMQPVGWYHSHTRSDIQLSEKDLQLYQQFFPEIWQIALVLRPRKFDPVRAGFFFREPDGSVHSSSSRHEFVVKPVGGQPSVASNPALPEPALLEPPPELQPESLAVSHPRSEPKPPSALAPAPRAASIYPRRRWVPSATVSAAAIAVALGAALFWIAWSRASTGLSLRALDEGGQLRIDWNRDSRVIRQSQSGALEIEDGSRKVHYELSLEHLRAGNITYLRNTGNVLVRLLVRGADRSTFTEMSRFLGPPVAAAATPPQRQPEQYVQHVELVEQPSDRTPPAGPLNGESDRQTPAPSAPARRRLVLPTARVPQPAEHFLPAPPAIAANTAVAVAPLPPDPGIPRLPVFAVLNPVVQGPAAGKIIWTGKLARSATIQILGNRASLGQITGGLPGAPVRVQVFPAELTSEGLRIFTADPKSIGASEAPGAQNGWNRTVYVLNPRKAAEIGILEAPGQRNAWNRLVLRAERGDHSIIVLRWERVPAESAAGAGNQ